MQRRTSRRGLTRTAPVPTAARATIAESARRSVELAALRLRGVS